jgi:hypothetical protein
VRISSSEGGVNDGILDAGGGDVEEDIVGFASSLEELDSVDACAAAVACEGASGTDTDATLAVVGAAAAAGVVPRKGPDLISGIVIDTEKSEWSVSCTRSIKWGGNMPGPGRWLSTIPCVGSCVVGSHQSFSS